MKPKSLESRRISSFSLSFLPGVDASHVYVRALGARLLLQSYQYPNLSEGADRVRGQLRGDKESPFSGVTKSGRIWRKVPESDAQSVGHVLLISVQLSANAVSALRKVWVDTNKTVEAT